MSEIAEVIPLQDLENRINQNLEPHQRAWRAAVQLAQMAQQEPGLAYLFRDADEPREPRPH